MADETSAAIARDSRYRELLRKRGRFTWGLTLLVVGVFFGFILLVAFNKALLARPIGHGVTSLGIVLGFAVILLAIVATASYVVRANRRFDPLVDAIRAEYER